VRATLEALASSGEVSAASASSAAGPPSIAALPFANMSADPEQEYFCDGIAAVSGWKVRCGCLFFVLK